MIYPEHITSTNHNYTAPLRILISHREIAEFLWLLTDLEAYWWGLHPIQHVIEKLLEEAIFFIFIIKDTVKGLYCHSYMLCLFDHLCFLASVLMGNQENEDKISGACVNYQKRICRVKVALKKLKIWIHFKEAVQSYKACFH